MPTAHHGEPDRLARAGSLGDEPGESALVRTGRPPMATTTSPPAVKRTPFTTFCCNPPRRPARAAAPPCSTVTEQRTVPDGQTESARERRGQVHRANADERVRDLAGGDELRQGTPRGVDRNREADAFGLPGVRADLRGDPDHAAGRVQHRAAGVPVRDRRVDLDRVRRAGTSRSASRSSARSPRRRPRRASSRSRTGCRSPPPAHRRARRSTDRAATGARACARGSTRSTPTSSNTSQPTIRAGMRSRSENSTYTLDAAVAFAPVGWSPAFVITCELVRIRPSRVTTNPEPWDSVSAKSA